MSNKPKTMFQFSLEGRNLQTANYGRMIFLDMGAHGQYLCLMQDFVRSREWAKGRNTTNNIRNDRSLFLDRLSDFLAKKGENLAPSKGPMSKLSILIEEMENFKISLKEYAIPVSVQEYFKQKGKPLDC